MSERVSSERVQRIADDLYGDTRAIALDLLDCRHERDGAQLAVVWLWRHRFELPAPPEVIRVYSEANRAVAARAARESKA